MWSKLVIAALVGAVSAETTLAQTFANYVAEHGKNYATVEEYEFRFIQFARTLTDIYAFNMVPDQTSTVGLNKYSDWTPLERKQISNYVTRTVVTDANIVTLDTSDLPSEINWIDLGAVNPVQDQGQCGSCWAFSAIAQMEGQHFIQSGELLKLSEQQCVDCDPESFGCSGGWQDNCMYYVQDNGGISLWDDYPYIAIDDLCEAEWNGPVNVQSVYHVKSYDQNQLMAAIAQGPTSVTIDASETVFHAYTGGIISDAVACGSSLDHAVVAVGYGTDAATGMDYYLIRNSWSDSWGDKGYVRFERQGDGYGVCGVQEISVWSMTN